MARQLTFDLGAKPALGREDFFVSSANAMALAVIEADHGWPQGKLILTGPAGAGKTHLAHVWAARSGAAFLEATALPEGLQDAQAVIVEDAQAVCEDAESQTRLFHLHNHLVATGGRLLLSAQDPPSRWPLTLPDLASRLEATQLTRIDPPDDALLAAVMVKQLGDRQLTPDPSVIQFILTRMERSFAAVTQVVGALDALALSEGRAITRPLAAQVLDRLENVAPGS